MTDAGGMIGVRLAARQPLRGRVQPAVRAQAGAPTVRRTHLFVALFALAGVILPSEVQFSLVAGARFTAGRLAAALLFLPALFVLLRKGRRFLSSDILAFATAAWMIVASLSAAGMNVLSSVGGDALDFLGGYLIARAYVFGRPGLDTFVRVLKAFAFIAIVFAMMDSISGRLIVHETFAAIVHASHWPDAGYRNGMVRAASTFNHEIAFGVFCALTAAILLYWEQSLLRRSFSVGLCLLGCILSRSSAALMTIVMILAISIYDQSLKQYSWRWSALWMVAGTVSLAFFFLSADPLGWVLSHLTLDPQTAYYRKLIWEVTSNYIALSPITGYAYEKVNNNIADGTVDSIWLLYSFRFGIPMVILFFLTNVAALLPGKSQSVNGTNDVHIDRMCAAFTLVILMFMFTGLTVAFWDYMLMFWGLCIGIRASLRELSFDVTGRLVRRKAYT